jgi:maleylacetate reductase
VTAFVYDALPGRVVFGVGASRTGLAAEIERLGVERVLLLATPRELPQAQELASQFGDKVVGSFSAVRPHVPRAVAQQARSAAHELRADSLLCIGGGSTIGTAKAIALETSLPIVAVPTTYAGSEMTPIWGLTTDQRKQTGRALQVLPKVVVYDPELTLSLPPRISGPSAINALAHCVEALYAPGANPITSLMAEEGMRAIARGVPVAVAEPHNIAGRTDTLYGAYLAGAALAAAGTSLHHKICHVLGGAYDLPHAELHTVVLPHVVAYLEPAIGGAAARIAQALGDPNTTRAASALFHLNRRIGAPSALQDIGLQASQLDEAVALVLEQAPQSPRPIDENGVRQIIEGAFWGSQPIADSQ